MSKTITKPGIYRPRLHFEGNFTTIPNRWIRNTGLPATANFLLIYLLTHEVGYNITFNQIGRETGMGETAIRTAMNALKDAGWLATHRTVDERGYNAGLAWVLQEPGTLENPDLENPDLENVAALEENLYKKKTLKETNVHFEELFDEFWDVYPRKQGKGAARKALCNALEIIGGDGTSIIDGARRYATDPNRSPSFTKLPATWLNQECWDDEPLPERVLSADEKKKLQEDELHARREREAKVRAEQAERDRLEREAYERERELNPIVRCEHGRILVMCRVCSPVS